MAALSSLNILLFCLVIQGALARMENVCTLRPDCCHADVNATSLDEGMATHEYELQATAQSHADHEYDCVFGNQDSTHGFHLATFETRKEYDCVMQFMLEEHGTQAAGNPVYLGLEADIADYRRNIFKWASPMSSTLSAAAVDPETPTFTAW